MVEERFWISQKLGTSLFPMKQKIIHRTHDRLTGNLNCDKSRITGKLKCTVVNSIKK